jgi:hypothetical protein
MRIAELLGDIEAAQDQGVELVTLAIDMTQGPRAKPAVPFATLKDALQYAHSMSDEQRSASWIRTPKKVRSIGDAEAEVAKTETGNQGDMEDAHDGSARPLHHRPQECPRDGAAGPECSNVRSIAWTNTRSFAPSCAITSAKQKSS